MRNHAIDIALLRFINHDLAHPVMDEAMKIVTGYGPWWLLGGALIVWLVRHFGRTSVLALVFLCLAVAATDLLCHSGIKITLLRDWGRPCLDPNFRWVRLVTEKCGNWFTFPSNHAANSMCVAAFWWGQTRNRALRTGAVTAALLVAFSRVYVGVHFPSDVAAGAAIGGVIGSFFHFLYGRLDAWLDRKQGIHQLSATQSS